MCTRGRGGTVKTTVVDESRGRDPDSEMVDKTKWTLETRSLSAKRRKCHGVTGITEC